MSRDTSQVSGKAPPESSPAPATRFEVPEFMVSKSLAEVRELMRLIALAEWAPDSYRDPEGNYVQRKIELAITLGRGARRAPPQVFSTNDGDESKTRGPLVLLFFESDSRRGPVLIEK